MGVDQPGHQDHLAQVLRRRIRRRVQIAQGSDSRNPTSEHKNRAVVNRKARNRQDDAGAENETALAVGIQRFAACCSSFKRAASEWFFAFCLLCTFRICA